ncbi:hypothetical protein ACVW0K_003009 [Streptomyces filamentosus]|uniref:hypothetical protein n=1 Tax=Streptomyces filamentosus TaxID=67294 RepID=UPI0036E4D78E
MERHVLEKLFEDDAEEASAAALAVLRDGGTYETSEGTRPAGQHAGVFSRRLQRTRLRGTEPFGLARAVQLLSAHGRPVRGGMIDSADRTHTFVFYLTEDDTTLVACFHLPHRPGQPPP